MEPLVILQEIQPNGLRTDVLTLSLVPNPDNSGLEYQIEYQDMSISDKEFVGRVGDGGAVRFMAYSSISHVALRNLANWIENNLINK